MGALAQEITVYFLISLHCRYIDDIIRHKFVEVENPEDLFINRSSHLEEFRIERPDKVTMVINSYLYFQLLFN